MFRWHLNHNVKMLGWMMECWEFPHNSFYKTFYSYFTGVRRWWCSLVSSMFWTFMVTSKALQHSHSQCNIISDVHWMKVFYNFLIYIFFIKQGISEKKTIREKLRFDKTDQGRENTVCMYVYLYLKKKHCWRYRSNNQKKTFKKRAMTFVVLKSAVNDCVVTS